jgi:hypothetical protein
MLSDSGKSFRRNPLIPVMWLSIGLLIAYLLHSLSESYETTLQRAQSESLVHARLVQGHAASTIERADLTLQSVIDHLHSEDMRAGMAISSERRQEIERTLIARQSRSRGVVSMSLTDAEGQVFANSVGATPGVSLASRNYFQALRKGPRTSPVISEAILGRVSNKWGVQVARRQLCWNAGRESGFDRKFRCVLRCVGGWQKLRHFTAGRREQADFPPPACR